MPERQEIWSFATRNLRVALEIEPCEDDPADSFEFEDDISAVRDGRVCWFNAHVAVYGPDGGEIARDVLCGCAYNSARDFYTSHRDPDPLYRNSSVMRAARGENAAICHYFPSMVAEACAHARRALQAYKSVPVRATA